MPTSPDHQPEDQSLLDTDILSAPGESIDPLVIRNASVQSPRFEIEDRFNATDNPSS
jgi:hypothetical protein